MWGVLEGHGQEPSWIHQSFGTHRATHNEHLHCKMQLKRMEQNNKEECNKTPPPCRVGGTVWEAPRAPGPEKKAVSEGRGTIPCHEKDLQEGLVPRICNSLKMSKKSLLPCSCCPGWACSLAGCFGHSNPPPCSQAARADSHCNSNSSLFTSWTKKGICKQGEGRGWGEKHNSSCKKDP